MPLFSYLNRREWAVDSVNTSLLERRLIFITERGVKGPYPCVKHEKGKGALCGSLQQEKSESRMIHPQA